MATRTARLFLSLLLLFLFFLLLFFLPPHVYGANAKVQDFRDSTKWLLTRVAVTSMSVAHNGSMLICVFGTTYFYREATDHNSPLVGAEIFSRTNPHTPIYQEWGIVDQPLTYALRIEKQWHISKDPETTIMVEIDATKPTANNTKFALISPDGKKQVSLPLSSLCRKTIPQPPIPPQDTYPDSLPNSNIGNLIIKIRS